MSTNREFEPIARAFMAAGPTQLADRVLESSLADVHHTRQRRGLRRAPWRTPVMNIYAKLAAAAVVVIAVGALGVWFLSPGSTSEPGGAPDPSASPSEPSAPSALPPASPSPTPLPGIPAPPLSETFTSATNGITLAVPEGWTTRPATEAWEGGIPITDEATADAIHDPALEDHLLMSIASMPLGGADPDQWATDQYASDFADECPDAEPITVDGATGVIGAGDCTPLLAFIAKGDRGYLILLRVSPDEGWLAPVYDRAWFESVLATVQLRPEDAVD
jgi:hypothetical protein